MKAIIEWIIVLSVALPIWYFSYVTPVYLLLVNQQLKLAAAFAIVLMCVVDDLYKTQQLLLNGSDSN